MKGFNHYLFWLSSLALFGVCGLYFSFYPSPAWKVLSVPCSLALGAGSMPGWPGASASAPCSGWKPLPPAGNCT